ncbi:Uncharacterised protein [Bordetella pertussis]|nr:Uncharacterised protein [Bordetella pertussis]
MRASGRGSTGISWCESAPTNPWPGKCLPQAAMPASARPCVSARDSMVTTRASWWKARLPITLLTP